MFYIYFDYLFKYRFESKKLLVSLCGAYETAIF
jgi:hypothetical protein